MERSTHTHSILHILIENWEILNILIFSFVEFFKDTPYHLCMNWSFLFRWFVLFLKISVTLEFFLVGQTNKKLKTNMSS